MNVNENAKEFAKALAWPTLMQDMSNAGVMACDPKYVEEAMDELWPEYLFYSESALARIAGLIAAHPEGLEGLKKDIKQGYESYREANPIDVSDW